MEKRSLAVAQVIEGALPAGLVGSKNDLDLADEFLEAEVDRTEKRRCVGAGGMHLLPTPRDGRGDHIDRRLAAKAPFSVVPASANVCRTACDQLIARQVGHAERP